MQKFTILLIPKSILMSVSRARSRDKQPFISEFSLILAVDVNEGFYKKSHYFFIMFTSQIDLINVIRSWLKTNKPLINAVDQQKDNYQETFTTSKMILITKNDLLSFTRILRWSQQPFIRVFLRRLLSREFPIIHL